MCGQPILAGDLCSTCDLLKVMYYAIFNVTTGIGVSMKGNQMTPQQTQVRVWWDTSVQAYRLTSSFNKALIEGLKKSIPASNRSFDDVSKIWTITENYLQPLQNLFKFIGVHATVITKAQAEAAQQSQPRSNNSPVTSRSATLDNVLVAFMRSLPFDAAQAAYRKATMLLHPDRNPQSTMDTMSTLNATWTRIA